MHWRYRYGLKSLYFLMWAVWSVLWTLLVFLTKAEHPILTVFIVGFLLPLVLYIGAIWIASSFRSGPDKRRGYGPDLRSANLGKPRKPFLG